MNTYTTKIRTAESYTIDKSKRNILLIGKADTLAKNKIIINPMNPRTAKQIYNGGPLVSAYTEAYNITQDNNIYTVNCQLYTDFIEIIDSLVQYDFDFIVPIDIYLRDGFVHPLTGQYTNFALYYLERLGLTDNKTILIMSDRHSSLYNSIDEYLIDMNRVYLDLLDNDYDKFNKYNTNLVFVLNNLIDIDYANVLTAASLSVCDFKTYPKNISYKTNFDIDYLDLKNNKSLCFYKYHPITNESSIEQLNNMSMTDNIYKKVLIDLLVKYIVKQLDMSEFNGTLFNSYVQVKLNNKVKKTLDYMKGDIYKDYIIKQVSFVKTGIGVGHIVIDISVTPYSLLENINIMMEV